MPHDERCQPSYFGSGYPQPYAETYLDLAGDVGIQVRLVESRDVDPDHLAVPGGDVNDRQDMTAGGR